MGFFLYSNANDVYFYSRQNSCQNRMYVIGNLYDNDKRIEFTWWIHIVLHDKRVKDKWKIQPVN